MRSILMFLLGNKIKIIVVLVLVAMVLFYAWREKRRMLAITPTQKWLNAAGSILLATNHGDFRLQGGRRKSWTELQKTKKMLDEYWGITDHNSARSEMEHLIDYGMRSQYAREMEKLNRTGMGKLTMRQLWELEKKKNPSASEDSYLPRMVEAYRLHGRNALLGWDVGRAAYILQACHYVGYLSQKETMELGVKAGKMAQSYFNCWDDLLESYMLGFQFWNEDDIGHPDSRSYQRNLIRRRVQDGNYCIPTPFEIVPWNAPLSADDI